MSVIFIVFKIFISSDLSSQLRYIQQRHPSCLNVKVHGFNSEEVHAEDVDEESEI